MKAVQSFLNTLDTDRRIGSAEGGPSVRRIRCIACLLSAVLCMSLADLYLTLMMLRTVGLAEENPIARAIMQTGSPALVAAWKGATLAVAIGLLWALRRRASAEWGSWVAVLVLTGVMLHWVAYSAQSDTLIAAIGALETGMDHRWVPAMR